MVITTAHVVRSFLYQKEDEKPYKKLLNSTKSSISVQLRFRGCPNTPGPKVHSTDIQCYLKRITIGRVSACDLCIPDDYFISRYHSAIECSRDDIGSKSGSSLKPDLNDPKVPKFGPVQPRVLDKKVRYLLQNGDVILIGKAHYGYAHEVHVTIHRPKDDLKDTHDNLQSLGGEGVVIRKLTWRRSFHCNGCMGWSRRHSCSARLSQLEKMILDSNCKSSTLPRPNKTAIQKALFHRLSGWWEKKPEKSVTFQVPKRYESDTLQIVDGLPDDLSLAKKGNEEVGRCDASNDEDGELDATFDELSEEQGEYMND